MSLFVTWSSGLWLSCFGALHSILGFLLFPKANKMEAAVTVKQAPLKRSKTKSCGCQAFRFDSCPIFVPTFSATMRWSIGRAEWCASHARSAPAAGSASRERSSNLGICPTWSAQVESQISQQICKIYTNPSDPSISKGASTIPTRQPPGNVGLRLRMVRLSFRLLRYLALPWAALCNVMQCSVMWYANVNVLYATYANHALHVMHVMHGMQVIIFHFGDMLGLFLIARELAG